MEYGSDQDLHLLQLTIQHEDTSLLQRSENLSITRRDELEDVLFCVLELPPSLW